jgi:hypothetical protein
MLRFFMRHEKSAKIDAGKTPATDKGYQAFLWWGGNPGYAWARKVVRQMDAADAKAKKKKRARASLVPLFTEIVKVAGIDSGDLEGIRISELVAVAHELDAAGLHDEADVIDSLLLAFASTEGEEDASDYYDDEDGLEGYYDEDSRTCQEDFANNATDEQIIERFVNKVGSTSIGDEIGIRKVGDKAIIGYGKNSVEISIAEDYCGMHHKNCKNFQFSYQNNLPVESHDLGLLEYHTSAVALNAYHKGNAPAQ